jgi:hypothetical protein
MSSVPLIRHQIPALTLRSLDGKSVSVWDFKQKRNRVIVLIRADAESTRRFLKELIANAPLWKEKETVALVVFPEQPAADLLGVLPAEVIVGVDAGGRSLGRYLGADAFGPAGLEKQGVFVADRYGELYACWLFSKDGDCPGMAEIQKALEQIEIACEECQTAQWQLDG